MWGQGCQQEGSQWGQVAKTTTEVMVPAAFQSGPLEGSSVFLGGPREAGVFPTVSRQVVCSVSHVGGEVGTRAA